MRALVDNFFHRGINICFFVKNVYRVIMNRDYNDIQKKVYFQTSIL